MTSPSNGRLAISLVLIGTLFCSLATAMVRIGGSVLPGSQSVRTHDVHNPASPVITDRTEGLAESGPFVLVHDRLFVAVGSDVRVYDGHALAKPPSAIWSAGRTVLSLAAGTEPGLVLVLDAASLRLVRFPESGVPKVVRSTPVDQSGLTGEAGQLVVRDGSHAFVADASIPGVRVVSIDPAAALETLAIYESLEGPVHDIALWNRRLAFLTESAFVLVDAGESTAPRFSWLGTWQAPERPSSVDLNSRRAFVSAGSGLVVLDVDPSSRNFLGAPVDSWTASSFVRSVSLDKAERAYVLLKGSYEVLDVMPHGGR